MTASVPKAALDAPFDLARELAVTGSVARGWADEWSDVELMALVDELPAEERVREWYPGSLAEVDAQGDIVWADGEIDGLKVELVFQRLAGVERLVERILACEVHEHVELRTAEAIVNARIVRGDRVRAWQARLGRYPPELTRVLVRRAVGPWESQPKLGIVRRGDRLPVASALVRDAFAILRILHAVNHRWEPTWKWTARRVDELDAKPPRAAERIEAALVAPDPVAAVRAMAGLARETLELVPPDVDVALARRNLDEVLAAL